MLAPEPEIIADGSDSGWRTEVTAEGEVLVFKRGRIKMPNGDVYTGEFLNNLRHGKGQLRRSNGDVYIGHFQNDLFHGKGTLSLSEHRVGGREVIGWKYSGTFAQGLKQGKGLLLDGEGGVYEGEFQNDLYHGEGTFKCAAYTYTGGWVAGRKSGKGRAQYTRGGWYEGQWRRGEPHGEGERLYLKGGTYRGAWRMGQRHGVGRRVWASGAEYEGEWADDRRCGRGVYRSAAGDTYVGGFEDDVYSGEGSLQLAQGDRYVGQFKRGMFCGRGRYEFASGGWYEGDYWALLRTGIKWRRDDRDIAEEAAEGAGSMRWAAGQGPVTGLKRRQQDERMRRQALAAAYSVKTPMAREARMRLVALNKRYGRMLVGSEWDDPKRGGVLVPAADGKRHGRGVRVWSSGARYEGDWVQDAMSGFGILIGAGPAGLRYEGQFQDGRFHGRGVCSWGHSGGERFVCPLQRSHLGSVGRCIYDGMWRRGELHGEGRFVCCDGRSYTGMFERGKRHGFGVEVIMTRRQKLEAFRRRGATAMSNSAERYEGMYVHNVKEGRGKLLMAVGDVIEGEFVRGKVHGRTRLTFASGKVSSAMFEHGQRKRWIDGAELARIQAAEAALDMLTSGGVSTHDLMGRARADRELAGPAAREQFDMQRLHVGSASGFERARKRDAGRGSGAE
ncbi:hypothetical protein FNF27_06096 [Cafeteria roenbergensis]|uniref:MORN repeat-containing protein 5 n=2 Tax=Cafeteria roenbergensis TaxID=33653 RepID=A0A5A8E611_CAFRO|nr:hypothetical protein FNF27_06096 [Cafeteria roenbergensis]